MSGKNIKKELILQKWRSKFLPSEVAKAQEKEKSQTPSSLKKFEDNKEPAFSL